MRKCYSDHNEDIRVKGSCDFCHGIKIETEWHELDADQAYRWWTQERSTWPLDRALRVWLAYEADFNWNPDSMSDQQNYDALFDDILTIAEDENEKRWGQAEKQIDRERDA